LSINDTNVLTRAYVARALGAIAAPESVPVLIAALADPHPWVRTNALSALGRVGAKDPHALQRSEDALRVVLMTEDPDPGTRESSIDPLGYYAKQNEGARKRLMEIAANGSRWERELAAGAIAKQFDDEKLLPPDLTSWAKVRVLEAASPLSYRLRPVYAKDVEPMVRANAMSTIADDRVDATLDLIRVALDDPDVIVRGYAIDRYAKSHDAKKLETLTAAEERAHLIVVFGEKNTRHDRKFTCTPKPPATGCCARINTRRGRAEDRGLIEDRGCRGIDARGVGAIGFGAIGFGAIGLVTGRVRFTKLAVWLVRVCDDRRMMASSTCGSRRGGRSRLSSPRRIAGPRMATISSPARVSTP
jgi:hypothetical protein